MNDQRACLGGAWVGAESVDGSVGLGGVEVSKDPNEAFDAVVGLLGALVALRDVA
jgi:hypothetical protein